MDHHLAAVGQKAAKKWLAVKLRVGLAGDMPPDRRDSAMPERVVQPSREAAPAAVPKKLRALVILARRAVVYSCWQQAAVAAHRPLRQPVRLQQQREPSPALLLPRLLYARRPIQPSLSGRNSARAALGQCHTEHQLHALAGGELPFQGLR